MPPARGVLVLTGPGVADVQPVMATATTASPANRGTAVALVGRREGRLVLIRLLSRVALSRTLELLD
ncbi:hypothetical protein GCM10027056_34270 [Glaciibacter psychrotolerans]